MPIMSVHELSLLKAKYSCRFSAMISENGRTCTCLNSRIHDVADVGLLQPVKTSLGRLGCLSVFVDCGRGPCEDVAPGLPSMASS